ncbi:hypothetical protein SEVCU129_1991 [Staphylococcus epidermidis VCU129]|nr:hypothetical protein GSEF_2244 [Staphylococcus epidermidis FRI909]EHR83628.1 hypothetical protein SEVCU118_1554 [Staphylococcus epidermidis VCU118]EHR96107.1 hypothetical protein SEVCU128_2417 [Staphylococcus epidermidis VCU128]EHS02483.1 hypothetical protein SEVCU129_1991 [Staphylococcus epidermidis VCU129]
MINPSTISIFCILKYGMTCTSIKMIPSLICISLSSKKYLRCLNLNQGTRIMNKIQTIVVKIIAPIIKFLVLIKWNFNSLSNIKIDNAITSKSVQKAPLILITLIPFWCIYL